MSRQTRFEALRHTYGFLPGEARHLSKTSRAGMQAPYVQRMILARRALWLNAQRYNWTERQYRDVIKRQYVDRGCVKEDIWGRLYANVWQLLRWYEDRTPIPEEYESPWRKKGQRRSAQKRAMKTITRKTHLQNWIQELEQKLANSDLTDKQRRALTTQRNNLQRKLESLK